MYLLLVISDVRMSDTPGSNLQTTHIFLYLHPHMITNHP